MTLEPSKTTFIQGLGARLISARVQYALGKGHRARILAWVLEKSERVYSSLTACESVNSNLSRPCNQSRIYVNQGFPPRFYNN